MGKRANPPHRKRSSGPRAKLWRAREGRGGGFDQDDQGMAGAAGNRASRFSPPPTAADRAVCACRG